MSRNYWQIAAGSQGRDYADYFLRTGMAFVGGESQIAAMAEVQLGDIVVLKSGLSQIVAAGEVVEREGSHSGNGDKDWLRDFDGWDLPAYCYVRWHLPPTPVETSGLTRSTITQLPQAHHRTLADDVLSSLQAPEGQEPKPTNPVRDDEILEFLISEGLRPGTADELTNTMRRIRLLAEYYQHNVEWTEVREHETRTFLIVPLLLSLGWAEQQMRIELPAAGGRADLVCFSKPAHLSDSECVLILESKGFSSGLDYAPEQARRYAEDFPSCRVVIVSNGFCYKSYRRLETGGFSDRPSAYFNISGPRDKYPLDPDSVEGTFELLRCLLPQSLR
jgi:hypothetical protein